MKPSEALRSHRKDIRRVVERNHTKNPRVFGSVLSGQDTDDSDLDLLVDPLPGTTLLDLGAIQIELEETLGISVDVLTPGDLPVKFHHKIIQNSMPV